MNEISFSKFERKELDLFFSICHKLKEKGTNSIQLDFTELKELSSYTNEDPKRFIQDLKSTYDKMLKLDFTIGNDPLNFTKFNLFSEYTVSNDTKTVTIATNQKFSYILNEINPYTKFELLEFVSLKSSYSKNLFKKLKQYTKTYETDFKTLFWEVSIDEFKRLLDIPKSYRMTDIDRQIFKPSLEDLKPYFKNLKIQKIKQGKSISRLKFTWLKQYENNDEVIDITISQDLQDAFDKVLINRFIKEVLTEENKHKLIAIFEEKDLIKGLKYAKKNIGKAFKNLSYLETSIKKGLIKPTIQTIITQTDIPKEEKNITMGEQLSIKTKVTQKEYEECYQEYLKTNNKKHGKEIRTAWEISVKNKFEIIEEKIEFAFKETTTPKEGIISTDNIQITMSYEELKEWGEQGVVHLQLEEFANSVIRNPYLTTNQKIELINLLGKQPKKDLVNYTSLSELLLSKTGKPLVGGALKMRLQKISNKEKIHIKYFDIIIEPKE